MAAEFHEDAGAAGFAADTVSLSVERFEASTDGALVVNEFNHSSLSDVRLPFYTVMLLRINIILAECLATYAHSHCSLLAKPSLT